MRFLVGTILLAILQNPVNACLGGSSGCCPASSPTCLNPCPATPACGAPSCGGAVGGGIGAASIPQYSAPALGGGFGPGPTPGGGSYAVGPSLPVGPSGGGVFGGGAPSLPQATPFNPALSVPFQQPSIPSIPSVPSAQNSGYAPAPFVPQGLPTIGVSSGQSGSASWPSSVVGGQTYAQPAVQNPSVVVSVPETSQPVPYVQVQDNRAQQPIAPTTFDVQPQVQNVPYSPEVVQPTIQPQVGTQEESHITEVSQPEEIVPQQTQIDTTDQFVPSSETETIEYEDEEQTLDNQGNSQQSQTSEIDQTDGATDQIEYEDETEQPQSQTEQFPQSTSQQVDQQQVATPEQGGFEEEEYEDIQPEQQQTNNFAQSTDQGTGSQSQPGAVQSSVSQQDSFDDDIEYEEEPQPQQPQSGRQDGQVGEPETISPEQVLAMQQQLQPSIIPNRQSSSLDFKSISNDLATVAPAATIQPANIFHENTAPTFSSNQQSSVGGAGDSYEDIGEQDLQQGNQQLPSTSQTEEYEYEDELGTEPAHTTNNNNENHFEESHDISQNPTSVTSTSQGQESSLQTSVQSGSSSQSFTPSQPQSGTDVVPQPSQPSSPNTGSVTQPQYVQQTTSNQGFSSQPQPETGASSQTSELSPSDLNSVSQPQSGQQSTTDQGFSHVSQSGTEGSSETFHPSSTNPGAVSQPQWVQPSTSGQDFSGQSTSSTHSDTASEHAVPASQIEELQQGADYDQDTIPTIHPEPQPQTQPTSTGTGSGQGSSGGISSDNFGDGDHQTVPTSSKFEELVSSEFEDEDMGDGNQQQNSGPALIPQTASSSEPVQEIVSPTEDAGFDYGAGPETSGFDYSDPNTQVIVNSEAPLENAAVYQETKAAGTKQQEAKLPIDPSKIENHELPAGYDFRRYLRYI